MSPLWNVPYFFLLPNDDEDEGWITGLTNTSLLMPNEENEFRVMFGGKILENWDIQSAILANKFSGHKVVHIAHLPVFAAPVMTKQEYITICKVAYTTDRFVVIYIEVYSLDPRDNPCAFGPEADKAKMCQKGFALCAFVDEDLKLTRVSKIAKRFPDGRIRFDEEDPDAINDQLFEAAKAFFDLQKLIHNLPNDQIKE